MNVTPSFIKRLVVVLVVVAVVLIAVSILTASATAAPPELKVVPLTPETASLIHGEKLYEAACAVCHGAKGLGDGPAAPVLKVATPDLTVLSRSNSGTFPMHRVMSSLQGKRLPAHGGEMPIWGPLLTEPGDEAMGFLRISNLVNFIESIQVQ